MGYKFKKPKTNYNIRAKVWLYRGTIANWHFITIPKQQSYAIKKHFSAMKRGWGSLPVTVSIGKTNWKTSIFPDTKQDRYILPLKAYARKNEGIVVGKKYNFSIQIVL